ncbi:EthD family reductase [Mycobacterium sp. DL99]|uniref:EthD family reductase n=1 Tax=Mycobacterium sp. DL99 TaxID=2528957 RepID=UPI00108224BB|nr:EthD family reductase [Mycobacterium sp. DL99]
MYRLTIQYQTPADPETFDTRYFEQHVPLCRPLPGLRAASFSKPRKLGDGTAPYLVAEFDFDDAAALKSALRSPEMAVVAKDAETLPAERVMFTAEIIGG